MEKVISLSVTSSFYDEGRPEIEMQGVTLMAFDEKSMSIQVNFAKPDYISQSISDSDVLEVEVLAANLFVDQLDY